jgi:hypothetical protein
MSNQDFNQGARRQYLGWMVGAALVLALIVGVFAYSGNNNSQTANSGGSSSTSQTTGSR